MAKDYNCPSAQKALHHRPPVITNMLTEMENIVAEARLAQVNIYCTGTFLIIYFVKSCLLIRLSELRINHTLYD